MGVEWVRGSSYKIDGVYVAETGAVGGPKEAQGPLAASFDRLWGDEGIHFPSYEKAEQALLHEAETIALDKGSRTWSDIDLVLGGDLLDQLITTNFEARAHQRPVFGLFSACATFTEGLGLASLLLGQGGPNTVMVTAASHHFSAERQFRFPLELGYQRAPTASWTATAAGAVIVQAARADLAIDSVTVGRVVDWGAKDPNDMASAMAPAAVDTIRRHLLAFSETADDYDAIVTGDLGRFGMGLAQHLAQSEYQLELGDRFQDCGALLYHLEAQDVHNGGSGPGCSASVFAGYFANLLRTGKINRLLLVATGALFSPKSYQQGESIPAVAHAVAIQRQERRL
jgi:stage V sporulation protein AD